MRGNASQIGEFRILSFIAFVSIYLLDPPVDTSRKEVWTKLIQTLQGDLKFRLSKFIQY